MTSPLGTGNTKTFYYSAVQMQLRPENRKKDPLKQWRNLMASFIHYDIYFRYQISHTFAIKTLPLNSPTFKSNFQSHLLEVVVIRRRKIAGTDPDKTIFTLGIPVLQ